MFYLVHDGLMIGLHHVRIIEIVVDHDPDLPLFAGVLHVGVQGVDDQMVARALGGLPRASLEQTSILLKLMSIFLHFLNTFFSLF